MDKIIEMEFGSHVYGTNLPTSDMDFKGVFLPEARDIILARGKETYSTSTKPIGQLKNSAADTDIELFSLKQYMKLLLEGQTVALTMLFIPPKHIKSVKWSTWGLVTDNKAKFLHRGVSAFAGYCRQQANKYGIKGSRVAATRLAVDFFSKYPPHTKLREIWDGDIQLTFFNQEHCEFLEDTLRGRPECKVRMLSVCNRKVQEHITCKEAYNIYCHLFDEYGQRALLAEKQEGIDWKALMHAVRVVSEAQELLLTHHITYPRPEADLLLKIRNGEMKYQEVADIIEIGFTLMEDAQANSSLPESPDYEFAEDLIYYEYLNKVIDI